MGKEYTIQSCDSKMDQHITLILIEFTQTSPVNVNVDVDSRARGLKFGLRLLITLNALRGCLKDVSFENKYH